VGATFLWGRSFAARRGLDSSFDSALDPEAENGGDARGWDDVQSGSAQTRLDEFEGFFRTHEARLSAYLWRMTGDRQSASDLSDTPHRLKPSGFSGYACPNELR
jgi:hypothetical protein